MGSVDKEVQNVWRRGKGWHSFQSGKSGKDHKGGFLELSFALWIRFEEVSICSGLETGGLNSILEGKMLCKHWEVGRYLNNC